MAQQPTEPARPAGPPEDPTTTTVSADPAVADPAPDARALDDPPPAVSPTGSAVPATLLAEQFEQDRPREPPPTRLVPRWLAWALIVAGVGLLPWLAGLALLLPETQQAAHYRAAWVGFDLALCFLLLRTGWLSLRGREHLELSAAMAGTLLLVDAWFDVVTANNTRDVAIALVLAVFGELPLAAFCLWIAGRVEYSRRQRATLVTGALQLLRRGQRGGRSG